MKPEDAAKLVDENFPRGKALTTTQAAIVAEAVLLRALDYDIILVDSNKNPGIVKDWPTHTWDNKEIRDWVMKRDDLSLAIRLGELIDIEIDAEDEETRQKLEDDFLTKLQGITTPSWRSRRGRHWLFRPTPVQRIRLQGRGCPSVIKVDGYEVRLGSKPAQSLIPTPGSEYRKWVVEPTQAEVADLPSNLYYYIQSSCKDKETKHESRNVPTISRPGDLFNERGPSWSDILEPAGWKIHDDQGDILHWTRPGKSTGLSATSGFTGTDARPDTFYIFSTDEAIAPLEAAKTYTRFEAWTVLNHDGDFAAAAAAALKMGFAPESTPDDEFGYEPPQSYTESAEKRPISNMSGEDKIVRPTLDDLAYQNPIGQYSKDLYDNYNIEADPVAILYQAFEIFGSLLGRDIWMTAEGGKIYTNDYLFVVGDKATGRKGTAWDHAKKLFIREDASDDISTDEFNKAIHGRVDSGEGMIKAMVGKQTDGTEFSDAPIKFLMQDSEGIALLNKSKIENATLQQNMMKAWDGTGISIGKSKEQIFIRKPHVSFVGHAQPIPLKDALTNNMDYSGFMSRIQFIVVERSRIYFDPPAMPDSILHYHHSYVENALRWARTGRELKFDSQTYDRMRGYYEGHPGIFREHRHVQKKAMMLAALRQSATVTLADLEAAIAMQDFVSACSLYLFKDWGHVGERNEDEEKILDFVLENPGVGISEISTKVFSRHKKHLDLKTLILGLTIKGKLKGKTVTKSNHSRVGYFFA